MSEIVKDEKPTTHICRICAAHITKEKKEKLTTKICKRCGEEKPLEDYYIAVRGKHERRHPRCIQCYLADCKEKYYTTKKTTIKKPHKPRGFAALPKETRDDIIQMMNDKVIMAKIARKHNLNYNTFYKWKRSGQICDGI